PRGVRARALRHGPGPGGPHTAGPGAGLRAHRRAPPPRRTRAGPVLRLATHAGPGAVPAAGARPLSVRGRSSPRRRGDRWAGGERGARDRGRSQEEWKEGLTPLAAL